MKNIGSSQQLILKCLPSARKKSVLNFLSLVCQFKDFMQKGCKSSKIESKRGHFAKNGVL